MIETIKYHGLDIPINVYKYRMWNDGEGNNHNRILTHREIFLSSPESFFADYPECKIPVDYDSVTEEMLDQLAYKHAYEFYQPPNEIIHRVIALQLRAKMVFHDIENRMAVEKEYDKKLNDAIGIFCTSTNPLSPSLWDSFAGLGTGYAVGFDPIKLNDFLVGSMGWAQYYPHGKPPIIPAIAFSEMERIRNMSMQVYSIPDSCKQEEEFRFIRTNREDDQSYYKSYEGEERKFIVPGNIFSEILLGPDIDDQEQEEILDSLDDDLNDLPVFKVSGINELTKEQIK